MMQTPKFIIAAAIVLIAVAAAGWSGWVRMPINIDFIDSHDDEEYEISVATNLLYSEGFCEKGSVHVRIISLLDYLSICIEFPSLSWLAKSPGAALKGIRKVGGDVITDMKANQEPIPEPLALKKFSGKFMIRIPPELHRRPAIEAAEEGVSLNRWASQKLAHSK